MVWQFLLIMTPALQHFVVVSELVFHICCVAKSVLLVEKVAVFNQDQEIFRNFLNNLSTFFKIVLGLRLQTGFRHLRIQDFF